MGTERGLERLVFFTDAVVAIAITLLVLPVVEAVSATHLGAPEIGEAVRSFLAFGLSFFVIARLWWAHHQVFEHVERYSPGLVLANMIWLFTIAVLPASTALIPRQGTSAGTVLFYVGTMCASSAALGAIALLVYRDHIVGPTHDTATRERLLGSVVTTAAFLLAAILGSLVPVINFYALLLIALTNPVEWLIRRRWARRAAVSAPRRR